MGTETKRTNLDVVPFILTVGSRVGTGRCAHQNVYGCFLLEVIRAASGWEVNDYAADDPVFSPHGLLHTVPYIRRDMLMIENQLPLLVLDRLLAVETGKDGVRADFELDLIICNFIFARWNCLNYLAPTDLMKLFDLA